MNNKKLIYSSMEMILKNLFVQQFSGSSYFVIYTVLPYHYLPVLVNYNRVSMFIPRI